MRTTDTAPGENTAPPTDDDAAFPAEAGGGPALFPRDAVAAIAAGPSPGPFRAILDGLQDGILITGPDDTVWYANRRLGEIIGRPPGSLVGRVAYRLLLPPERWPDLEARNARRRDGIGETYEIDLLRADGTAFPCRVKAQPFRDECGRIVGTVGILDDVSERRAAEAGLRDSEARFRGAFHGASIGMAMSTPDTGRFVEVNDAFCRLLGYSREEVLRLTVAAVSLPDDQPENLRLLRRALAGEIDAYAMEKRYRHKDGSVVYTHLSVSTVRDDDGAVRYLIGQVQDLGARKRAEEARRASERALAASVAALRASEERYRLLADSVDDIVALHDGATNVLYVTPSTERHTGWRPDEVIGRPVADFVHPDDRARVRAALRAERSGRGPAADGANPVLEWRHRCRDGSFRWMETRARRVAPPEDGTTGVSGGGVPLLVTASRDITERREQREKLRRIMRGARCLIWEADVVDPPGARKPSWRLEFAEEDAARRWLPVRAEPGQNFHAAWTASKDPDDLRRMDDTSMRALRGGRPGYEQEFRCLLADGGERWLHEDVRIEPLPSLPGDPEGTRRWRAVGVCTDITDRKRMQEQMVRTEKLAALGELVAGIAHEVNNPLAAVSGHAQLLQMHPDPAVRQDAAAIRAAADRAARILRSLLTFARQGGGDDGEKRIVPLNALAQTCEDLVRIKLRRADIALTLDLTDAPAPVRVNETQIEQVLVNLVNNAEHALRDRPGERRIVLRTAVEPPGVAAVYVADNGAGMPPEVASRVFDPLFTTKAVGEGTGLGLSICHGIAEAHGGDITLAHTAPGRGATFRLSLPLAAGADGTKDAKVTGAA